MSQWQQILARPIDPQKMYYIHPSEDMFVPAREILKQESTMLENTRRDHESSKIDVLMSLKRRLLSKNNLDRLKTIADSKERGGYRGDAWEQSVGWVKILLRELNEITIPVVGEEMKGRQEAYEKYAEVILSPTSERSALYSSRGSEFRREYEDLYGRYSGGMYDSREEYAYYTPEPEETVSAKERLEQARKEIWDEFLENYGEGIVVGALAIALDGLAAVGAFGLTLLAGIVPHVALDLIYIFAASCVGIPLAIFSSIAIPVGLGIGFLGAIKYGVQRIGVEIAGAWWKHKERKSQSK